MDFVKSGLLMCVIIGEVLCCIPPPNIEGVAFTSGEQLNLQAITSMGTENIHYFKDSSGAVRYTSHYSPNAMVFIGNYGLSYQENVKLDCMGIVYDQELVPESRRLEKNQFDFAQAVKMELLWLREHTVISLSDGMIDSIFIGLDGSENGGVQYWTHQKTPMGYNTWFVKDTVHGVWGEYGADGVNSAKSVRGLSGCSSVYAEFELPPEQFLASPVLRRCFQVNSRLSVLQTGSGNIRILFSGATPFQKSVSILDMAGRRVLSRIISENHLKISGLHPGMYILMVQQGKQKEKLPVMIMN